MVISVRLGGEEERGRDALPTAAVGDEELQIELILGGVGSGIAIHGRSRRRKISARAPF
jgi:hypothetical protein